MTPSGIESEHIRLVEQCLNQLRYRVPNHYIYIYTYMYMYHPQCNHELLRNFVVSPGCGDSVADF